MGWETIFDKSARAEGGRLQAELALVASILAEPSLVCVAVRAGVRPEILAHADLRMMFSACVERGHRGQLEVLRLIRRVLELGGQWTSKARAWERRECWSAESLASFACSWPANPAAVRANARRVVAIYLELLPARLMWRGMLRRLDRAIELSRGCRESHEFDLNAFDVNATKHSYSSEGGSYVGPEDRTG